MSKTNVLLQGPIGTGKTSSLLTVRAPLFVLATEPGIDKILFHRGAGLVAPPCHWHYVPPAAEEWDTLQRNAVLLNTLSNDQLQKQTNMNKAAYRQFIEVLNTCSDFRCDVCGESFGPVDQFPADSVFATDGLTGLSKMSMDLVVGGKPIASQPDWGAAMNNLERFLAKCCSDTKCTFVLIAHVDREVDEITGGTLIMPSTLGRKLAPKIPRFFDEVVLCRREGKEFFWSTSTNGVDLKSRRLPFGDELLPDFSTILDAEDGAGDPDNYVIGGAMHG